MGFIIVLFWIVVGFYLLGLLGRIFLRYFVMRKMKQFETGGGNPFFGGFYQRSYGRPEPQEQRKEGDVTISVSKQDRRVKENVGEYVEYEEEK